MQGAFAPTGTHILVSFPLSSRQNLNLRILVSNFQMCVLKSSYDMEQVGAQLRSALTICLLTGKCLFHQRDDDFRMFTRKKDAFRCFSVACRCVTILVLQSIRGERANDASEDQLSTPWRYRWRHSSDVLVPAISLYRCEAFFRLGHQGHYLSLTRYRSQWHTWVKHESRRNFSDWKRPCQPSQNIKARGICRSNTEN